MNSAELQYQMQPMDKSGAVAEKTNFVPNLIKPFAFQP